jgi:integrase
VTGVDRDPESGAKRKVVPHSFRAAFATASELAGVPDNDVADRANWKRGSESMLRYRRRAQGRGDRNPAVMIRRAAAATPKTQDETP